MKCPWCGERLMVRRGFGAACLNLRCVWTGDECELMEPKPLGETVYWKPGFERTLNRVTVGAIRGEVENG
jgi:hypothetical protein